MFVSPPWGGTGYLQLEEYSLEHIYPDFDEIIAKSLEYSGNLMLFLPKNTSIDELVARLLPYHKQFIAEQKSLQNSDPSALRRSNELVLELEQLYYGN